MGMGFTSACGGYSPPILGFPCAPVRCKWHMREPQSQGMSILRALPTSKHIAQSGWLNLATSRQHSVLAKPRCNTHATRFQTRTCGIVPGYANKGGQGHPYFPGVPTTHSPAVTPPAKHLLSLPSAWGSCPSISQLAAGRGVWCRSVPGPAA